tara:strand:- start:411 stop:650 length:240 start_codon:yes stop_codon:yes gene_type:complete
MHFFFIISRLRLRGVKMTSVNKKEDQNQVVVSKFANSTAFFSQAAKQNNVMKRFLNDVKNSSFSQSVNSFKAALKTLSK